MKGLHVYRGRDYADEITISTRDAIAWGKEHMKPMGEPGKQHHYTDTNYYLLGFIVESITGSRFTKPYTR